MALPKGRQIGPYSPFFCVCFRATAAPSVSSRLCFTFPCHSSDPIPPIATRHSRLRTHAFHPLVISSPSRLDCCPVTHACGSGNNKPRTLLPFTLARVLPSGTLRGFIFILCTSELSRRLTLRYIVSPCVIPIQLEELVQLLGRLVSIRTRLRASEIRLAPEV